MSETKTAEPKSYDPLEPMRAMRDNWMSVMAKSMIETVNSDAYASANGALLENTLNLTAPMRDAFEKSMLQALQQLSLPSRDDVLGLAGRFTNFEMRMDDMDASLAGLDTGPLQTLPAILEHLKAIGEMLTQLSRRMDALEAGPQRGSEPAGAVPTQPSQPAAPIAATPAPVAQNNAARRDGNRLQHKGSGKGGR